MKALWLTTILAAVGLTPIHAQPSDPHYCAAFDLRVVEGMTVNDDMAKMFHAELEQFIDAAQHHYCPERH